MGCGPQRAIVAGRLTRSRRLPPRCPLHKRIQVFFPARQGHFRTLSGISGPAQPDFTPIGIERARTKIVIVTFAGYTVEDDAVSLHFDHPASFLIHDLIHAPEHSESTPTELNHFRIEK